MDLVTVILFLVMYYLRPQEWHGAFSTIHFVQIVMLTALGTLFFRDRSLRLKDLFRTPHDWMVLGFWLWLVLSAPHPWDTFKDNANLLIFYVVIVQTLSTIPRSKKFLAWWTYLIVAIAALALASMIGFDPRGSKEITENVMKGRLVFNLSIFNNPNALGHSVVPAIPMIYYYCIWKRPIFSRVWGTLLMALPLLCIYFTESKGAFLAAGVTMMATMCFGRPKWIQIMIVVVFAAFGTTAMYALPRMHELDKSRGDEAIQGRVAAFKHGYRIITTTKTGVGKGEWFASFFASNRYYKAAHSSYVMIGGELGYPGLFFLCGIIYCCLRTVITAHTQTPDEERIRRMLFVLVLSYAISSWMVNFEYRPTFFMFTAAIAALHRHLLGLNVVKDEEEAAESTGTQPALDEPMAPAWRLALQPQPVLAEMVPAGAGGNTAMVLHPQPTEEDAERPEPTLPGIGRGWNKIGWFDIAASGVFTWAVVKFWAYIMMRM